MRAVHAVAHDEQFALRPLIQLHLGQGLVGEERGHGGGSLAVALRGFLPLGLRAARATRKHGDIKTRSYYAVCNPAVALKLALGRRHLRGSAPE